MKPEEDDLCPTSGSESKRLKLDIESSAKKDKEGDDGGEAVNGEGDEVKGQQSGNGTTEEEGDGGSTLEEGEGSPMPISGSSMNRKSSIAIEANDWFGGIQDDDKQKGLELEEKRKVWEAGESPEDDKTLRIFQQPFRHGEIRDFVKNREFVEEFKKLFTDLEFQEKASDLFQFQQSFDLNSVVDPSVYSISQYLTEKVLPFMKELTGLPLNQTIDMFLSIYKQTDFLLCHDDELDSRRIAFIWYLSDEWTEEDGGTLDLFSATDALHPEKIVKKIVPEYNKFVFFEVGVTSFHQVSEVLKGKTRLALSGWFYGDPLPRPTIEFLNESVPYNVLENFKDFKGLLKKLCHEDYLEPDMQKELNKSLCEESQLLIPAFLQPDSYKLICESIVETDVSKPNFFKRRGPVNLVNFEEAMSGPSSCTPPSDGQEICGDITMNTLRDLFHSTEFLTFLENLTEFPFTTLPTNRVISSLHKYTHGSYTLMKGGVKHTGMADPNESDKKSKGEDDSDEEEEPNFIDLMFFFSHKWCPEWGGEEVYCITEDGEVQQQQVMSIEPEGNALALAVRASNVASFTKYVNCLAEENVYFVYKMTFAFDGKFE